MGKINIAIAGVGNAASALLQGLIYYKDPQKDPTKPIGGIHVGDIECVSAFDVVSTKVNKPLNEAILAPPNNCPTYCTPKGDELVVKVLKGPTLDGISNIVSPVVEISPDPEEDVVKILKEVKADMLIALLPSGAQKATEYYAQAALDAGAAFINCGPAMIASDREWARKFKNAGLPLVGDDLQSQLGGTRLHKGILEVLTMFGAKISNTYQLDVSGGMEGLNTIEPERRHMKREIKSESIQRTIPNLGPDNIASGTTDYLDFLENQRVGHFWIEGTYFLNAPITIDITMRTFDGANAAGTLVDVIRATKIALDRAVDGPLISVSAYGFKKPPVFVREEQGNKWFEEFIEGKRSV
ncbi:MAG: inositol-3-phosphate synthase [Candidatus Hodarchaeales archaeon]|jgi:myo-inositol-1-phosphate synthase